MTKAQTCECGTETLSFVDIIGHKGLIGSRPCCHNCARRLRKGAQTLGNGDIVVKQTLMRWHNREYKPKAVIEFLFAIATSK